MQDAPLPSWLRDVDGESLLDLAVQPGAKRSEISGLHDGALRVRIAAPAIDGRGNAALCAWLAVQMDLPRRAVRIERGDKSRRKQLRIALPAAQVLARLGPRVSGTPA